MNTRPRHKIDLRKPGSTRRIHRRNGLLVVLLLSMVPFVLSADGPGQPVANAPVDEAKFDTPNHQMIGPGKVRLTVTRDGRWVQFAPTWGDGASLITSGGFVVYAEGADGRLKELVNTARGGLRVTENAGRIGKCSEGTKGGFRAPSPDPDDDQDGRVDEDQLDGADNDNDGRVDEDFAAIGDEMIATSYYAPETGDVAIDTRLLFQQESYAWSLPHIDGMIVMSLRVKNVGAGILDAVRVGAFFEKEGPFHFSKREVDLQSTGQLAMAGPGSAIVCEDVSGTAIGLVVFPVANAPNTEWTSGCLVNAENAGVAVLAQLNGDFDGESMAIPVEPEGGESPAGPADSPGDSQTSEPRGVQIDGKAVVYGISPSMGSLMPDDEMRIDLALIAVRESSRMTSAAANAYKTYEGDGVNRYLPPPVSMTPRVLWGTYRSVEGDEAGGTGVVVDIVPLGDDPIAPDDISYLNEIDEGSIVRREIQPGVEKLILRGEAIGKLARKGERIVLKGRLEDGEFFEAILRPDEDSASSIGDADVEAELYWKTGGRLSQEFLNSSPNPFRDVTTVFYEIPSVVEKEDGTQIRSSGALETSVKVYNVVGRLVSVLVEELLGPGVYATEWRAVDDNGNPVASGVYYVKLQIGMRYLTKRVILLK